MKNFLVAIACLLPFYSVAHAPAPYYSLEAVRFNKAKADVYQIAHRTNPKIPNDHPWMGSGFQVMLSSGAKVIITNDHVCDSMNNDYVYLSNRAHPEPMAARIIAGMPEMDICAVESVGFPGYYSVAPVNSVYQWEKVHYYGYPSGFGLSTFDGNLLGARLSVDDKNGHKEWITTINNMAIGGNSGGPVLDEQERVLGVIMCRFTQDHDLAGYVNAMQLNYFLDFLSGK